MSVRPADYPIVIRLDNGAGGDDLPLHNAVAHFIERIGQRLLALGTLGNVPKLLTTFEDDRTRSRAARRGGGRDDRGEPVDGGGAGGTDDSKTGSLFSAIVILSATAEDASQGAPTHDGAVTRGAILHVVAKGPAQPAAAQAWFAVRTLPRAVR
jgi:hypothetical protein